MTIAMYSRTSWREVEPNFTVGQMDGEFAGTIERRDNRFEATTGTGDALGVFRTATAAERALERAAEQAGIQFSAPTSTPRRVVATYAFLMAGIFTAGGAALMGLVTL